MIVKSRTPFRHKQTTSPALCSHRVRLGIQKESGSSTPTSWPPWQAPGSEERARDAGTLSTLAGAGLLSRASAVGLVAAEYGIADAQAELRRIEGEQQGAAQARVAAQAAGTTSSFLAEFDPPGSGQGEP